MLIRILIVDDCFELRKLMSDYLESQDGISVIGEASNGIEALDYLSKNEVDIILLDIVMPKMDGFAMLEKLRCIGMCPRPKVIVVSSLARPDFIKRAYDLGAYFYIIKPFAPDELLYQIRKGYLQQATVV